MLGTHAFSSSPLIGSLRSRLPVAMAMALATAGATGGTAGSPIPLGYSAEAIRCLRAVLRGQPVDVIALQREDKVLQYTSDVAGSSSPPR